MFVPGKPFQPSLMFVGKAGEPEMCFTLVGSGLTRRLGRLDGDKHTSLLRKSVNYGRNKFYDTGCNSISNGQAKKMFC